jgi:hypothetical protein
MKKLLLIGVLSFALMGNAWAVPLCTANAPDQDMMAVTYANMTINIMMPGLTLAQSPGMTLEFIHKNMTFEFTRIGINYEYGNITTCSGTLLATTKGNITSKYRVPYTVQPLDNGDRAVEVLLKEVKFLGAVDNAPKDPNAPPPPPPKPVVLGDYGNKPKICGTYYEGTRPRGDKNETYEECNARLVKLWQVEQECKKLPNNAVSRCLFDAQQRY